MIGAENDSLIDIRSLQKMAAQNSQFKLIEFPVGHFDIYRGAWFERVIAEELTFIQSGS